MKIVADESVDFPIVKALRDAGHDVWFIAEISPGISDEEVLNTAVQKEALLLTADKNFGELIFRQRRLSNGVILIRLSGLSPKHKAKVVQAAVELQGKQMLGHFTVISHSGVRIRRRIW